MPNPILPRRSFTASSTPQTTDAAVGELLINYADGKIFTKNPSGSIVSFTLGGTVSASVTSVAGRTGAVTLTASDVSGVVPSTTTGITGAAAITNMVSLTAAQYAALGTKSSTTLYIISG